MVVTIGTWGLSHQLNCSVPCGISLSQPVTEPKSSVLEGKFLTTGSEGKFHIFEFYRYG